VISPTHSHSHTQCLHPHTFACAQPHSLMFACIQFQPPIVWPGCHVTTASLTFLSRLTSLMHWLTSSLDILNLAVEGQWIYWHSIGIHVDVVDDFSNPFLSFSLFQAIKPPVVLLVGCGVLVRLMSRCDSLFWSSTRGMHL
jgi:hypothetical protein